MNRLPKFGGDHGQWVYDRIIPIECKNVIPKDKQDHFLLDKMFAEREGIIYQAVKALQTVIRNGYRFSESDSIKETRQAYLEDNSSVISFFQDCMISNDGIPLKKLSTVRAIHNAYRTWCEINNNGYAKSQK